jgi:hypothetical protein
MSVERRLREGLEASASVVDVEVDQQLRRVLDRDGDAGGSSGSRPWPRSPPRWSRRSCWSRGHWAAPLDTLSIDVRPGGRLRATMVADADGSQYPVDMVFREVVAPQRLVLAWGDPQHPVPPEGLE